MYVGAPISMEFTRDYWTPGRVRSGVVGLRGRARPLGANLAVTGLNPGALPPDGFIVRVPAGTRLSLSFDIYFQKLDDPLALYTVADPASVVAAEDFDAVVHRPGSDGHVGLEVTSPVRVRVESLAYVPGSGRQVETFPPPEDFLLMPSGSEILVQPLTRYADGSGNRMPWQFNYHFPGSKDPERTMRSAGLGMLIGVGMVIALAVVAVKG